MTVEKSMYKALIVDDEELTRDGIRASINWDSFQIDTVLEAQDGREGLELAEKYKPEVVLTDVRMPQMNGTEMVEKLRKFLPETGVIFMSGYSDKEYLMAAIRYKAVRYVEKPLDLLELEDAIREALEQYHQYNESAKNIGHGNMKTQDRMISLLSRHDFHGEESLEAECSKLGYTFGAGTCFDVMLLKFTNGNTVDDFPDIEGFTVQVDDYISNYGLKELHTNKYDQYLIIFMYGPRMNDELMLHIARKIHQIFADAGEHFLSLGSIRTGVEKAYDSYTSAVILMQGSFFFRRGSLIVPTADEEAARVSDTARYASDFGELLSQRDRDGTLVFLDRILENFRSAARLLLPNQVKDDYYKLFIALENAARSAHISTHESETILDYLDHAHTLYQLHETLCEKTKEYFDALSDQQAENSTIFAIQDYIARNYMDPMLSVKTISDYVNRSAPYVCTMFKKENDQTLNQYITEYRIEKAKRLLENQGTRISEISSDVGYTDGNYFGKSFKKYVGLTPSEYREKMLP